MLKYVQKLVPLGVEFSSRNEAAWSQQQSICGTPNAQGFPNRRALSPVGERGSQGREGRRGPRRPGSAAPSGAWSRLNLSGSRFSRLGGTFCPAPGSPAGLREGQRDRQHGKLSGVSPPARPDPPQRLSVCTVFTRATRWTEREPTVTHPGTHRCWGAPLGPQPRARPPQLAALQLLVLRACPALLSDGTQQCSWSPRRVSPVLRGEGPLSPPAP